MAITLDEHPSVVSWITLSDSRFVFLNKIMLSYSLKSFNGCTFCWAKDKVFWMTTKHCIGCLTYFHSCYFSVFLQCCLPVFITTNLVVFAALGICQDSFCLRASILAFLATGIFLLQISAWTPLSPSSNPILSTELALSKLF